MCPWQVQADYNSITSTSNVEVEERFRKQAQNEFLHGSKVEAFTDSAVLLESISAIISISLLSWKERDVFVHTCSFPSGRS